MANPFHGGAGGAKLAISTDGGTVYTAIGGVQDARLVVNREEIEVTDHDSAGWKEYIAGNGDITLEVTANYEEGDAGQDLILDNIEVDDGTLRHFRFRPKGTDIGVNEEWIDMAGFVTGSPISTPTGGANTFNFSIRVSGAPTRAVQS